MSRNMWLTKACPSSSTHLRATGREGMPPDTIMLGTESVPLLKEKHGKLICPDLPDFKWECVPGFVLTEYKSQSRTMGRVLLGLLYGRSGADKCDIIDMY